MTTKSHPKLFVSYSWTSPDHEAWVLRLATDLRDSGVDVILDKWDLREGNDAYAFMEKMVSDKEIEKVILICDHAYASKADGRSGGVGTEAQIISPEIYAKEAQNKFVAIVVERDENGNAYLPTYYKSRIYIDLSDPSTFAKHFDQLLRWAFDKPLYVKPDLGKVARFLSDDNSASLGTMSSVRRAIDAVRTGRESWAGAVGEYFSTFTTNLERFRVLARSGEADDQLVEDIESFLPFRNEAIELFFALAQCQKGAMCASLIHRFFEELIPYLDRPEDVRSWSDCDFDHFRFVVHELFLHAIAILLKYQCFDTVGEILGQKFYMPKLEHHATNGMVSFSILQQEVSLLEHRNNRLKMKRLSLHADLLKERSHNSGLGFRELMQADLVLFIRESLDLLRGEGVDWRKWWPITSALAGRQSFAVEIFARSESRSYFQRVMPVFGISTKDELTDLVEQFNQQKLRTPNWQHTVDLTRLIAAEKIGTRQ